MFSRVTHTFLVATGLAPVLITAAVAFRSLCWPWLSFGFLVVAFALVQVCKLFLHAGRARLESMPIEITTIEANDAEILAFLVAYMLPLAGTSDSLSYDWPALLTAIAIVALVVFQTGLAHVNPLMGLLGWRFFKVNTVEGSSYVLVSRKTLAEARKIQSVGQIASSMLLDLS